MIKTMRVKPVTTLVVTFEGGMEREFPNKKALVEFLTQYKKTAIARLQQYKDAIVTSEKELAETERELEIALGYQE